jgi:AcrR family transcriptional regulator
VRRDKRKNRERILNVAAGLITPVNADSISLEEIARAAEVTRPTIYNHFSSREQLLEDLVLPALEFLDEGLMEIQRDGTGFDGLAGLLCELYVRYRGVLELQSCSTLRENQRLEQAYLRFRENFISFLDSNPAIQHALGNELSMRIIGETYIPILRILNQRETDQNIIRERFQNILTGMLLI